MNAMQALLESLQNSIVLRNQRVEVRDEQKLLTRMDGLAYEAVLGDGETKAAARWLIWEIAQTLDIRPASINETLTIASYRSERRAVASPRRPVRSIARSLAGNCLISILSRLT